MTYAAFAAYNGVKAVFFMRGRPIGVLIGLAMIGLGVLILLAMLLPAGVWWFMLGLGLVFGGWGCCRRRW